MVLITGINNVNKYMHVGLAYAVRLITDRCRSSAVASRPPVTRCACSTSRSSRRRTQPPRWSAAAAPSARTWPPSGRTSSARSRARPRCRSVGECRVRTGPAGSPTAAAATAGVRGSAHGQAHVSQSVYGMADKCRAGRQHCSVCGLLRST